MNSSMLIPLRRLNSVYNDHLSKSTTFSQSQKVVDLTGFIVLQVEYNILLNTILQVVFTI